MDNQHRKIKGYRELSQAEIDLMNEIKAKGVELGELCAKLEERLSEQSSCAAHDEAEKQRIVGASPFRWLAIGRTHLQEGLMALTRSIAQPTFF